MNNRSGSNIPQPSQELILRFKKGDSEAFRIIVEMLQQYTYNLAFRFLLNEEDAKDAVQDSFVKIWKNRASYKPKGLFTTWLYRIVANDCLDKLKSEKLFSTIGSSEEILDLEEMITNKDLARQIKILSRELSPKQRMVFILKDLQDLTLEEISQILSMPKGRVKSNLYYARKNIRERLILSETRRIQDVV